MQALILNAIVALCLALAILFVRQKGPERFGWLAGIVLAGLAALFSPSILQAANGTYESIGIFLAIGLGITLASLLINRMIAALLPIHRARTDERLIRQTTRANTAGPAAAAAQEAQAGAAQEPESREGRHSESERAETGVIDIEEERRRRQMKRQAFSEEYFYAESEPLEAETDEDKQQAEDMGDWLLAAEAENKTALETAFAIEHKTKVVEADIVSLPPEDTELDVECFIEQDEEPADPAMQLLDSAWKHREAGQWEQSLRAYEEYRGLVGDNRLRMEVMVEELATMLGAGMAEAATDKVFEILSFDEELSESERKQVIKALEYLQNT